MVLINVKTIPNSKRVKIKKLSENSYSVRLDKPATDGKANIRLVEVLAEYFDVQKSSVTIIKGHKSKDKLIEIR